MFQDSLCNEKLCRVDVTEGLLLHARAASPRPIVDVHLGLQVDSVGSRLLGGLDDVNRLIEILIVIGGHLSDQVGGCARPRDVR